MPPRDGCRTLHGTLSPQLPLKHASGAQQSAFDVQAAHLPALQAGAVLGQSLQVRQGPPLGSQPVAAATCKTEVS
jgi:hypothetical protein